ncbi:MAG: SUMF1/EgtB/PvdO family nonheme iron enzyme [Planctomycetaceae bacterium]
MLCCLEIQWLYACRAGSSGTYGFGEPVTLLERYAQYIINSSGRSDAVESLLPNAVGLFDMHGNLWEWMQNSSSGSMSPVTNNVRRVLRGGSFGDRASNVRSTLRSYGQPTSRGSLDGFRPSKTWVLFPS